MNGRIGVSLLLLSCSVVAVAADSSASANRYAGAAYAGADATAKALLQTDLNEKEVQTLIGHLAARHDDFETVVELLEEAVDEQPDNAHAQLRFGQLSCRLAGHPDTGMIAKAGLAGDCRDALEAASKLDPKQLKAWQGLFDFYRMAPGVVGGGEDKAEALLPTLAALEPAAAELAKAALAKQREQPAQMRVHYQNAARLSPEQADEIRFQEAMMLVQLRDYPAARDVLVALQKDTDYEPAAVQYQLGRIAVVAVKAEWYADAEQQLLGYLARADVSADLPAKSWAAYRLGQLYELMGKPEQSKARYQWAASQQPDDQLKAELKKKGIKA